MGQGWVDGLRAMHPDEAIYTFWDYFRQHWPRNRGLRIDHLLLSSSLASRLKDANVDRWVRDLPKASDHAPTWVELGPVKQAARPAKAAAKKPAARKTTTTKSPATKPKPRHPKA